MNLGKHFRRILYTWSFKSEPKADYGPNPETPGFTNGVLVSDAEYIYIRHKTFDMDLANVDAGGGPHLMPLSGFLDGRVGFLYAVFKGVWAGLMAAVLVVPMVLHALRESPAGE